MSKLNINHPHTKTIEELKPQIEELASALSAKYGASTRWSGDNIVKLKASGVEGTLTLAENNLSVDIKLGMMASFLKPQIEAEIRNYLADKV